MISESDSKVVEDDEEKNIYQLIYDMYTTDDREEENKKAQSPSSSSEHSPVHMKYYAERSLPCIVSPAKESDMETVDNIQEMPVQKVNVESIEEKPWMKAGADISDYFNYGFDEKSWNTYCKKQTKLRAANAKLSVQKGHNRHGEEELGCAYFSSAGSFTLASRESSPLVDVIGGQSGSSRGVERHQCPSDDGSNTQVVTEMSSEEDRITSYHPTFPSNFSFLFAYSSPPPFLYRRGPPPLSPATTLDSCHGKECDDPSTSQYRFLTDVSSLIPGTVASSTGVTNTAKGWEDIILQEKCDKDRDRSREHGHDKNSKRRRDRERWSCSSQNSAEEQIRHRETMEQGHRRHSFEGDNGEKEEWCRERRHKSEGWQTSSHSSSTSSSRSRSRRDNGKDRKSQNRRSHKKTRKNAKDMETNKTFSSDNDEMKT